MILGHNGIVHLLYQSFFIGSRVQIVSVVGYQFIELGKLLLGEVYLRFIKQKLLRCPIINIGVDANNQNTLLLQKVKQVIEKIQDQMATIIENGIEAGEISSKINAMQYAKRLDTMIQGAIFMTYTMDDEFYIKDTMSQIDQMIHNELKI